MKNTLLSIVALALSLQSLSAEPPTTTICEPTTVIVSTTFDQATPPTRKGTINGWQAGIGEWSVKDGALHGDELEENHHPSSCTYRFEATDMIITAQFRLGTAKEIAFACRDTVPPNNHLGRTFISKDAIWVTRMSGISKTTKSEKLAELKTTIGDLPDNAVIVYVSKYKSYFEFLCYYTRYMQAGLPYPQLGFDCSVKIWQPVGRLMRAAIALP